MDRKYSKPAVCEDANAPSQYSTLWEARGYCVCPKCGKFYRSFAYIPYGRGATVPPAAPASPPASSPASPPASGADRLVVTTAASPTTSAPPILNNANAANQIINSAPVPLSPEPEADLAPAPLSPAPEADLAPVPLSPGLEADLAPVPLSPAPEADLAPAPLSPGPEADPAPVPLSPALSEESGAEQGAPKTADAAEDFPSQISSNTALSGAPFHDEDQTAADPPYLREEGASCASAAQGCPDHEQCGSTQDDDHPPKEGLYGRGLLQFEQWWKYRDIDVSVNGALLSGIPAFLEKNTLRIINSNYSYFIPLEKVDYIRTTDGFESSFQRKPFF